MKQYLLTLVFMFFVSVIAIGSPEPDRQTPQIETAMEKPIHLAIIGHVSNETTIMSVAELAAHSNIDLIIVNDLNKQESTIQNLRENEVFKISKYDRDFDDGLFDHIAITSESLQEESIKSTWKPYRMPIYTYKASIKPPLIRLHRA